MSVLDIFERHAFRAPKNIIHIGANVGQEVPLYNSVSPEFCVHIEPIPSCFETIQQKIKTVKNQTAIQALCSDSDNEEIEFNISSHGGHASSMFDMNIHSELYPDVKYTSTLRIRTSRLDTLLKQYNLQATPFDLLVIDVQGAEKKVFDGATTILSSPSLQCIYAEVSHASLYNGGCSFYELNEVLSSFDFYLREVSIRPEGWGNAIYWKKWWMPSEQSLDDPYLLPLGYKGERYTKLQDIVLSSKYGAHQDTLARSIINYSYSGPFCFHTDKDKHPQVTLELERAIALDWILVYNRVDSTIVKNRAKTMYAEVSEDRTNWRRIHSQNSSFSSISVQSDGKPVRFIRLGLREEEYFHLRCLSLYEKP